MPQLDHYRLLGRSGLRVSPLSLGTMTFGAGGAWGSDDAEAARMVDHYVDRGGNFIDTANYYGNMGGSERLLGEILGDRRERLVLSTKYSLTTRPADPNAGGNQRKSMVRSVEDSLKRLKTDYIDLFYLHMWDYRTPADEILRAFDDLVRMGKVLYIGLSDTPATLSKSSDGYCTSSSSPSVPRWQAFASALARVDIDRLRAKSDFRPSTLLRAPRALSRDGGA